MVVILYGTQFYIHMYSLDTFSFDITQPWATVIYMHTKSRVH